MPKLPLYLNISSKNWVWIDLNFNQWNNVIFKKNSSLICSEFVLVFLQFFPWFFYFLKKFEFEYIWILTNETILFSKTFFTNLLRICSSLCTKIFLIFLLSQKNQIWIYLNFNQRNNAVFENFHHDSAQNVF
jgi:hypothetical protein